MRSSQQQTDQLRRNTLIVVASAILGVSVYGYTVLQGDYLEGLKRGKNGQVAIQMLDGLRRPFLAVRQAELRLLRFAEEASAMSRIEDAIDEGRQKLSTYREFARYNEELEEKVAQLEARYEAWESLEWELVSKVRPGADPSRWTEDGELDELVYRSSSVFHAVLEMLGNGESLIHDDIEAGAVAIRGLLVSSLGIVAYLTGLVFWREWARHHRERMRYENELRLYRLAHRDSLTGLANRVLLDDRFSIAIAGARRYGYRVSVLYVDLNGFKDINDRMGHEAGDAVLQEVALRLQKQTREMDTVARVGGDEFVVLLTHLEDAAGARVVANTIEVTLNHPFEIGGKPCSINGSIGIAVFPDDGTKPDQLLKHADSVMYQAKRMTRSAVTAAEVA